MPSQNNISKIIHIDMDAYYAAVEQRDNPSLKNKALIVGGSPEGRGVVSTCSYEAREFGVHSAMSSAKALRLCPHAIFLRPDFSKYKQITAKIHEIFEEYTDKIEPLSLDEAYLDVTGNKKGVDSATLIAKQIRDKIRERTRLTASAGVSYNKFLAKVASDWNKPDGLTLIKPEDAQEFIDKLPIGEFHGIGEVTEERLKRMGIHTGKDLRNIDKKRLIELFGKQGIFYYKIARGIDNRSVETGGVRKSIGKETTLSDDVSDMDLIHRRLSDLASQVSQLLDRHESRGHTVTLKVRYDNFETITRSFTFNKPVNSKEELLDCSSRLLDNKTEAGKRSVRLLGITVSNFEHESLGEVNYVQLKLPLWDVEKVWY